MDDKVRSPGSVRAEQFYTPPAPPADPAAAPPQDDDATKAPETLLDAEPDLDEPPRGEEPADDEIDLEAGETPADEDDSETDEPVAARGVKFEDGDEVQTVEQLAEAFEFDPGWLEKLTVKQTIRGEDVEVPLAEALQTHRQVQSGDSYLAEAKSKAKEIIHDAETQKSTLAGTVAVFGELLQEAESMLKDESSEIDWRKLKEHDPAEYLVKKGEFEERERRLQSIRDKAQEHVQSLTSGVAERQQEELNKRLPTEHKNLLKRLPDWKDAKVAGKERVDVSNYLQADGFAPDEIRFAAFNGKVLALAVKAMRYDDMMSKSNRKKARVTKVPRVMKPGSKEQASKTSDAPTKTNGAGRDRVTALYGS